MEQQQTSCDSVILVVEDEMLLRLYASDILEEEGFLVIEAGNADAALKILEARADVRLLFTDIDMPGKLDGLDLAREVHERWPDIRLVITSGHRQPTADVIPDDGRFVGKPYSPADLLNPVHALVDKA